MDILLVVGIGLVIFGAIVLLKFPDRPGGKIALLKFTIFSRGAGMPLIALGVLCIMASNYEVNLGNLNITQAVPTHQATQIILPTSTVPQSSAILTSSATPATMVTTLPKSVNSISPANTGQVNLLKSLKSDWVNQLAWSPDGKMLAIATTSGLYLYDAQTFNQTCNVYIEWIKSIAFSPDGQTLATASYDGIKLWKVDGCGELGTVALTSDANSVDFSPDGTKLAAGIGMTVKLFDVATKSELKTFVGGHQGSVYTVAFSPDGKMLASAMDGIKLWDVESGLELHTMEQEGLLGIITFSPDGKILASGSVDGTIKLWDVASGLRLRTLTGHTDRIGSVAFSPDGRLLASASWDLTIRLWDVESGHELRTLTGHTSYISSVAFSPDGSLLASGASDDAVRLWGITPQK